ncbi:MAG TPA: hypothetical protein VGD18_02830 [Thiobacillaceae bacterium]
MFTNTGLVLRLLVGLVFLAAALLLLRSPGPRVAPGVIAAGAALVLAGNLYGLVVLRPFIGRYFNEHWAQQVDLVDAMSTIGMLVCGAGVLWQAFEARAAGPRA